MTGVCGGDPSDDFSHLTQSQTSGFIWQNADICIADACTWASHAGLSVQAVKTPSLNPSQSRRPHVVLGNGLVPKMQSYVKKIWH